MFTIVDNLKDKDGAKVTELANDLELSKSTVHRHLSTLKTHGYVVQKDDTYRIGLEFLNLGVYARDQYPLYSTANEKIIELAEATGEQTWCMIEEDGVGRYLCSGSGEHRAAATRVGKWTYLHQTACGKALLAHLPDTKIERIIDRHGLLAKTEQTITNREDLYEEIEDIREQGVAFNKGESVPRLHAVGAPIRHSHTEEVLGAISISGPAHRLKGDLLTEKLPERLLGLTNEIEINLSFTN